MAARRRTVTAFTRANQDGYPTPPLTWDYAKRLRRKAPYDKDLALTTCRNGHTLRISGKVHTIATDGTVTPSYVCVSAAREIRLRSAAGSPSHGRPSASERHASKQQLARHPNLTACKAHVLADRRDINRRPQQLVRDDGGRKAIAAAMDLGVIRPLKTYDSRVCQQVEPVAGPLDERHGSALRANVGNRLEPFSEERREQNTSCQAGGKRLGPRSIRPEHFGNHVAVVVGHSPAT